MSSSSFHSSQLAVATVTTSARETSLPNDLPCCRIISKLDVQSELICPVVSNQFEFLYCSPYCSQTLLQKFHHPANNNAKVLTLHLASPTPAALESSSDFLRGYATYQLQLCKQLITAQQSPNVVDSQCALEILLDSRQLAAAAISFQERCEWNQTLVQLLRTLGENLKYFAVHEVHPTATDCCSAFDSGLTDDETSFFEPSAISQNLPTSLEFVRIGCCNLARNMLPEFFAWLAQTRPCGIELGCCQCLLKRWCTVLRSSILSSPSPLAHVQQFVSHNLRALHLIDAEKSLPMLINHDRHGGGRELSLLRWHLPSLEFVCISEYNSNVVNSRHGQQFRRRSSSNSNSSLNNSVLADAEALQWLLESLRLHKIASIAHAQPQQQSEPVWMIDRLHYNIGQLPSVPRYLSALQITHLKQFKVVGIAWSLPLPLSSCATVVRELELGFDCDANKDDDVVMVGLEGMENDENSFAPAAHEKRAATVFEMQEEYLLPLQALFNRLDTAPPSFCTKLHLILSSTIVDASHASENNLQLHKRYAAITGAIQLANKRCRRRRCNVHRVSVLLTETATQSITDAASALTSAFSALVSDVCNDALSTVHKISFTVVTNEPRIHQTPELLTAAAIDCTTIGAVRLRFPSQRPELIDACDQIKQLLPTCKLPFPLLNQLKVKVL